MILAQRFRRRQHHASRSGHHVSIREDFAEELRFLRGYDTAHTTVRENVDLPDRRLDLLLRLLHQNNGRLAKAKREQFAEITDAELEKIEAGFAAALEFNVLALIESGHQTHCH